MRIKSDRRAQKSLGANIPRKTGLLSGKLIPQAFARKPWIIIILLVMKLPKAGFCVSSCHAFAKHTGHFDSKPLGLCTFEVDVPRSMGSGQGERSTQHIGFALCFIG